MAMKSIIPNALTLFRGIIVLLFIPLFSSQKPEFLWIYILFIIASTTDFLDGYLARKWRVISSFGKIFDPLIDKIFTYTIFFLIIQHTPWIDTWIVVLFLIRDLFVDGIKNFLLSQHIVTSALWWGKAKFACLVLIFHTLFLSILFPTVTYLKDLSVLLCGMGIIIAYVGMGFYMNHLLDFLRR